MKQFRTYEMALNFYREAQNHRLRGEMKKQFERASLSICLNLAEGTAKPSAKERARFYRIALGSLREIQTLLLLGNEIELTEKANYLGAMLYKLCKAT